MTFLIFSQSNSHYFSPAIKGGVQMPHFRAVTKSDTGTWGLGRGTWDSGTWDVGCGTWDVGRGTWDVGTQGRRDSGTQGLWDVGTWGLGDSGTWDARMLGLWDVRGLEDMGRRDLRTNGFPEVNISVKISKDTARVFKD